MVVELMHVPLLFPEPLGGRQAPDSSRSVCLSESAAPHCVHIYDQIDGNLTDAYVEARAPADRIPASPTRKGFHLTATGCRIGSPGAILAAPGSYSDS